MPDEISYHVLSHPYPEDFVAWYPYTKPEVMAESEDWRRWLERVIAGDTPGLLDRFVAARHDPSGEWIGVVWASVSQTAPEVAHFGWFYIEQGRRGGGVGGRIIDTYLSTLAAEGVQAVMLPTQLENQRAIGMYYRRGWQLSITDPRGGVWMVREPAGFYREYFTPDPRRPIHASPPEPADFVALDYLLSRPAAPIRLLPLGLAGSARFISFTHDWESAEHSVARQGGRPVALAVAAPTDEGPWLDVFGLDRRAMAVAMRELLERVPGGYAEVAAGDASRRAALEDVGMRVTDTSEREIAGAAMGLCRYVV